MKHNIFFNTNFFFQIYDLSLEEPEKFTINQFGIDLYHIASKNLFWFLFCEIE